MGGEVSESAHVTAREHDPAKNKDRRSADPKSSSRGRWRAGPGGGQFYSNQGVVWPYAGPCSPQKGGARSVQKPEDTQRLWSPAGLGVEERAAGGAAERGASRASRGFGRRPGLPKGPLPLPGSPVILWNPSLRTPG